ncbi:CYTH domain-containing protein [Patescibacteria group bacterium]|nr:CYTH domain-containing protein [Patescibacteria group bacterium]
MIEVEKKFILSDDQRELLIREAEFLQEIVFCDVYYDNQSYDWTLQDIWLRARGDKFELKVSLDRTLGRQVDQYDEITDVDEIKKILNLEGDEELSEILIKEGFVPICECKTTRKKYRLGEFAVDMDLVEYDDYSWSLVEIELMVNKKSEIADAARKIMDFASQRNWQTSRIRGKVTEYLKRKKSEHY